MPVINKKVTEGIGVKMLGFAEDVYLGMRKPNAKQLAKSFGDNLKTQGIVIGESAIKGLEADYEKQLAESAGRVGNKLGNFLAQGTRESIKDYKKAKAVYEQAIASGQKDAAKFTPKITTALKKGHGAYDDTGKYIGISGMAVAGTAVSAGIVGRVATGGGLYRDRYGNVNVPGVPFI